MEALVEESFDKDFLDGGDLIGYQVSPAISQGVVRIFIHGHIRAENNDTRLLIRVNGENKRYDSYITRTGADKFDKEYEGSAFYLGRNNKALSAYFSADYTISWSAPDLYFMGQGFSSFDVEDNADRTLVGHSCFGGLPSSDPLSEISIGLNVGNARGFFGAYFIGTR